MENILAENMRRFGTKNLSEQFSQKTDYPGTSAAIYNLLVQYIETIIPTNPDGLVMERLNALGNLPTSAFTSVMDVFGQAGYMPQRRINGRMTYTPDARILEFQRLPVIGVRRYINDKGVEVRFDDGIMAAITVKEWLRKAYIPQQTGMLNGWRDTFALEVRKGKLKKMPPLTYKNIQDKAAGSFVGLQAAVTAGNVPNVPGTAAPITTPSDSIGTQTIKR